MKYFLFLAALATTCYCISLTAPLTTPPWNYGPVTSNQYQACQSSRNTALSVGGTACVVFNPVTGATQWSVTHSLNVLSSDPNLIATALTLSTSTNLPLSAQQIPNIVDPAQTNPSNSRNTYTAWVNVAIPSMNNNYAIGLTLTYGTKTLSFSFDYGGLSAGNNNGFIEFAPASRNKQGTGYKVPTTYQETFQPFGSFVLLRQKTVDPISGNKISGNQMIVVALGPSTVGLSEGQTVLVNMVKCASQLVQLNDGASYTDDVLSVSPYCSVVQTDILGVVNESSYGANRALPNTAHIKKAVSTSWSAWSTSYTA